MRDCQALPAAIFESQAAIRVRKEAGQVLAYEIDREQSSISQPDAYNEGIMVGSFACF